MPRFLFLNGIAFSGFFVLLLFLRWWLHQIRRLERAEAAARLALQREHLARDLHDDLGSKLAQISLLGELTARDPVHAPRLGAFAREVAKSLDGLVWTLHPERDSLEHLAAYLGEVAREFVIPAGLELELDFPSAQLHGRLSPPIRKAVMLAVQESLHNIVKHAGARRARLAIEARATDFTVTVEDDGRGLADGFKAAAGVSKPDPSGRGRGHGLENMRRRLAELGGRCELGSRREGGTYVRLVAPLCTPSS